MGGHMEANKTFANSNRFYYLPGMFDEICALAANCFTCQRNKHKPKPLKKIPLEEWQNETVPFRTVHIEHKGLLHPICASSANCFLDIDAFYRFLMVYPVRKTTSLATISAVEKWIFSFGIPQSINHD